MATKGLKEVGKNVVPQFLISPLQTYIDDMHVHEMWRKEGIGRKKGVSHERARHLQIS